MTTCPRRALLQQEKMEGESVSSAEHKGSQSFRGAEGDAPARPGFATAPFHPHVKEQMDILV